MLRIPDYTHNVSLRMSQVMDEIGINEKIVIKRRKTFLLRESMDTLTFQLSDRDANVYYFGSQTEGTTTQGLRSDFDLLFTMNNVNIIQDWSEWEYGKVNYLMIQDETVSPGYCLLQVLRKDAPLPTVNINKEHEYRDERGRILLKNTMFNVGMIAGQVRHGPALSVHGGPGFNDTDHVDAFTCQFYPIQARQLLVQQREGHWPSREMIQYCNSMGCFVVGVGNKGSQNEILEWRISTSLAERCLMLNLNITQIRCYVLMKIIMKAFVTSQFPESISSFMCKTVLLHCISNTRTEEWKESTLLTCLTFCLTTLYNCVLNEYCPHFLIPENNLMMRRFSQAHKPFILDILYYVIESNGRALLEIETDNFGLLLRHRLCNIMLRNVQNESIGIAGQLMKQTALDINECFNFVLYTIHKLSSENAVTKMSFILSKLINTQNVSLDSKCLIAQQLCLTCGSVLSSLNRYRRINASYNVLSFISLGLNSDVASGKLKLASMCYCIGETARTELILINIEQSYDVSVVEPICKCYDFENSSRRGGFDTLSYESNKKLTLLKHITAFCVRFLRCEVNCCPHELRHEMFRSTQEDLAYRNDNDKWMDMAVVDSRPYLYFLQYKIYSRQGKVVEKRKALSNLMRTIENEPNLRHVETALNLLGQCMENENRKDNALTCYMLSLKVRGRNNAAKFLICRLISSVINGRVR